MHIVRADVKNSAFKMNRGTGTNNDNINAENGKVIASQKNDALKILRQGTVKVTSFDADIRTVFYNDTSRIAILFIILDVSTYLE